MRPHNPLTPGYTLPVNTEALDYWSVASKVLPSADLAHFYVYLPPKPAFFTTTITKVVEVRLPLGSP